MASPGAVSHAWISAEASLPPDWQVVGHWRFAEVSVGLAKGPEVDDCASGSGLFAERTPRRLSDRQRERRGSASG
jgi:hypothetical protein